MGKTILISSHILPELADLCNKVGIIEQGELLYSGPVTDILRRAGYDSIPGTWSGWLQAMARVKQVVGPGKYAILLPTTEWAPPVVLALQDGSTLLKDGGRWGAF